MSAIERHREWLRDAARMIRNYEGGCTYPEAIAEKLDAMAAEPIATGAVEMKGECE